MKIRLVLRVLAVICGVVSCSMLMPLALSVYDGSDDAWAFLFSILSGLILAVVFMLLSSSSSEQFSLGIREGVGATGFSWITASALGALPYWYSGSMASYTDAFFEAVSGFTTTGATVLSDIEALPRGLLLWRSLTHWAGGMGIIVLSLAVLPFLGVSGMEMYRAEVPGVTAGKLTPRLHQTAVRLWGLYVVLTLAEAVLLYLGGMGVFDAFCHSCSTLATGGFSTKNSSIAGYGAYIQWVVIVFMFLSGVNFSLYFLLLRKPFREVLSDEELRAYIRITFCASASIALCLYLSGEGVGFEFLARKSLFHVVSVMTTTGFVADDYDLWPPFTKLVIIILMVIGACGGSTGGGCKVSRIIIIWRRAKCELLKLLHPRAVILPSMDGRPLGAGTVSGAGAFMVFFVLMLFSGALITAAYGIDILTAFTGVLTCLSNVGPGLGYLGATESFGWLPSGVKWLFALCMLAGRLELFAVILLVLRGTYGK